MAEAGWHSAYKTWRPPASVMGGGVAGLEDLDVLVGLA